jgi:hypothetical protein
MGNIITIDSGDGSIKSSLLADHINNWAKTDYHDGLNYDNRLTFNTKGNNPIYNNLLKKRACCTGQNSMTIALPNMVYDDNDNIIGVTSVNRDNPAIFGTKLGNNIIPIGLPGNNNKLDDPYIPVKINIFSSAVDMSSQCVFENANKYSIQLDPSGGFTTPNICKTLYRGEANSKGLCQHVESDRMKLYSTDTQIAYGPFNDDDFNVYADCNCENSLLRGENKNISIINEKSGKQVFNADDEMIAQFFDNRCFSINPKGFRPFNAIPSNLCINIDQTKNISAESKSTINKSQTCNLSTSTSYGNEDNDKIPLSQPRAAPNPNYIKPTTQAVPEIINKGIPKTTFIATVSSISVILIILLVVIIYLAVMRSKK